MVLVRDRKVIGVSLCPKGRRLFSVGSKLVIWLSAILCFVALVRHHSESTIIITFTSSAHSTIISKALPRSLFYSSLAVLFLSIFSGTPSFRHRNLVRMAGYCIKDGYGFRLVPQLIWIWDSTTKSIRSMVEPLLQESRHRQSLSPHHIELHALFTRTKAESNSRVKTRDSSGKASLRRRPPITDRLLLRTIRVLFRRRERKGLGKMRLVLWCALLFSINLLNSQVFADQIFSADAGGTFSRSSREPKYTIEFHQQDAPFHPDDDQESVVMSNKFGEKFLCFLPKVKKLKSGKPVSQQNTSSLIVETEKRIKLKTPDELLEKSKNQIGHECVIHNLRQDAFRIGQSMLSEGFQDLPQQQLNNAINHATVVQEFVLGVYDAEATAAYNQNLSDISTLKDPRSNDASQRYHAHQYGNGTLCDLTNQPRETEVRFVCSEPRAMISSITELSTCKYALTVQCPMLCKHPLFQEERPVSHTIDCNVLPKYHKKPKSEEDSFQDEKITMVTDVGHSSAFDLEEHAT
ncbi:hypothetical protein TEA_021181 [Camellia sinensis var. sinensis]|uniref:MRH domain-containing protein n=1 Tax=Camellia sinensis var. sinensis TaxID=542762 RepID=A0A4S4DHS2_CAMSN|nr:hypothetical protein TEA_021181 [Camellia sinensis var. sinensis]